MGAEILSSFGPRALIYSSYPTTEAARRPGQRPFWSVGAALNSDPRHTTHDTRYTTRRRVQALRCLSYSMARRLSRNSFSRSYLSYPGSGHAPQVAWCPSFARRRACVRGLRRRRPEMNGRILPSASRGRGRPPPLVNDIARRVMRRRSWCSRHESLSPLSLASLAPLRSSPPHRCSAEPPEHRS